MKLSKQEFKANVDGDIQSEEVKIMLQKTDFDTVEKVEKLFDKMSDLEVLECIRENKALYASTDTDRMDLIADLCAIIEADEKCTVIEEQIVKAIRRMLE